MPPALLCSLQPDHGLLCGLQHVGLGATPVNVCLLGGPSATGLAPRDPLPTALLSAAKPAQTGPE